MENQVLAKKLKDILNGHGKLNFYSKHSIKGIETIAVTKDKWFSEQEKALLLRQNNERLANKLKVL